MGKRNESTPVVTCPLCGKEGVGKTYLTTHQKAVDCIAETNAREMVAAGYARIGHVPEAIIVHFSADPRVRIMKTPTDWTTAEKQRRRLRPEWWGPVWLADLMRKVRPVDVLTGGDVRNTTRFLFIEYALSYADGPEAFVEVVNSAEALGGSNAVLDIVGRGDCKNPLHPMVDCEGQVCCPEHLLHRKFNSREIGRVYFEGLPNIGGRQVSADELERYRRWKETGQ